MSLGTSTCSFTPPVNITLCLQMHPKLLFPLTGSDFAEIIPTETDLSVREKCLLQLCNSVSIEFCHPCMPVLACYTMKCRNIGGPGCDFTSHFGSIGGMAHKHTVGVSFTLRHAHSTVLQVSALTIRFTSMFPHSTSDTSSQNHNTRVARLPLYRCFFCLFAVVYDAQILC